MTKVTHLRVVKETHCLAGIEISNFDLRPKTVVNSSIFTDLPAELRPLLLLFFLSPPTLQHFLPSIFPQLRDQYPHSPYRLPHLPPFVPSKYSA